jgi:hypothetical protein
VDVVAHAGAVRRRRAGREHVHAVPLAERRFHRDLDEVGGAARQHKQWYRTLDQLLARKSDIGLALHPTFDDGSRCGWFGLRRRRILFQAGEACCKFEQLEMAALPILIPLMGEALIVSTDNSY